MEDGALPRALVVRNKPVILLDTNVLLLYLLASADGNAVRKRKWKRTGMFNERHESELRSIVQEAGGFLTTPHILTEVSNLSGSIPNSLRYLYWAQFRKFIELAREIHVPSARIAVAQEFQPFGLADAAIIYLELNPPPVVITVDYKLYSYLIAYERPVIDLKEMVNSAPVGLN